jgi:Holliday junction resolvasome RuvABC endonuclease subunit
VPREDRGVVIGIDPSLAHTGVCRAVGGRAQTTTVFQTTPEASRPARLAHLRDAVRGFITRGLAEEAALVVAMESPIWSHNPELHAAESAVYGVLQLAVWDVFQSRPGKTVTNQFLSVNPQQVKKWLGAKEKAEVLLRVYKLYGQEFRDHNEADAYTLAMIGCNFWHYAVEGTAWPEVTKAQLQVLEKLRQVGLPWEQRPKPRGRHAVKVRVDV